MSNAYYIVANDKDLPCDNAGRCPYDRDHHGGAYYGEGFPGAYSYESEAEAVTAAENFTARTGVSHAVYKIVTRHVQNRSVSKQVFT